MFLISVKTAPTAIEAFLITILQYSGNCNSTATQKHIRDKMRNSSFYPGVDVDSLKIYCGSTTFVGRRRRSSTQQLSIKMKIKVTTTRNKASQDPSASQLIAKVKSVAADVMRNIKAITDWNSKLGSNINKLDRVYTEKAIFKTCAEKAEIYQANATSGQECGEYRLRPSKVITG